MRGSILLLEPDPMLASIRLIPFRVAVAVVLVVTAAIAVVVVEGCRRARRGPNVALVRVLDAAQQSGLTVIDAADLGVGKERGRAWWLSRGDPPNPKRMKMTSQAMRTETWRGVLYLRSREGRPATDVETTIFDPDTVLEDDRFVAVGDPEALRALKDALHRP
jgi:hypothetical protein